MSKEFPTQSMEKPEATEVETTPEEVVEETTEPEEDTTKNDPLDTLDDPEELRKEAKKYRGIASRKTKPAAPAPEKSASEYVTREELYADNRKEAARLLTEVSGEDDVQAEVKREFDENWDDIMTYYVSRRGQAKAEDIARDAMAAYAAWKADNGQTVDDSARQLQTTIVGKGTGGSQKPTKPATDTSDDARFSKPKPPTEWYPKKD